MTTLRFKAKNGLDGNSQTITNVADPVNAQDVATRAYVLANTGTVTSVAALTLGTTGTDVTSTVATGTTTPVITLNIPTASATNRGALSAADWAVFNGKASLTSPSFTTPNIGVATASSVTASSGFCSTSTYTVTFTDGIVADYTTGIARLSTGPADGFILYNGGVANTALFSLDTSGIQFKKLVAPTATTATATLTIAQLLTGCLTATPTAAASYTLPTGALIDTAIATYCTIGQGFEWSILNNAAFIITVVAGTGHTVSGGMGVAAGSAAAPTNASFRTIKTAAATYITYRIA